MASKHHNNTHTSSKVTKDNSIGTKNLNSAIPRQLVKETPHRHISPVSNGSQGAHNIITKIINFERELNKDQFNYDSEDSQSEVGVKHDHSKERKALCLPPSGLPALSPQHSTKPAMNVQDGDDKSPSSFKRSKFLDESRGNDVKYEFSNTINFKEVPKESESNGSVSSSGSELAFNSQVKTPNEKTNKAVNFFKVYAEHKSTQSRRVSFVGSNIRYRFRKSKSLTSSWQTKSRLLSNGIKRLS